MEEEEEEVITRKTLGDFARHTGIKENVARKYVALHMRMVHPAVVYPFVGSDYQLVALRTHSPSIDAYREVREVDPTTYIYLMKHGYENRLPTEEEMHTFPGLQHFTENMLPRPIGEEAWVNHERTDHWKARAYYLGLNWKNTPGFFNLIKGIHGSPKGDEEFNDFYHHLCNYQPYSYASAKEIGLILQDLKANQLDQVEQKEEEEEEEDKENETHGDLPTKDPIVFVVPPSSSGGDSTSTWSAIQDNTLVKSYLERAGLTAFFSPEKAVKQMILSSLRVPIAAVPGAERIIPMSQSINAPLPPVPAEAWPVLVSAMELMNVERHTLDPESPALRDILTQGGEINALSTIQTVLTLYHPECTLENIDPLLQARVLKKHPTVDMSVMRSIIEM